jgi:site-specific DNA recombinase
MDESDELMTEIQTLFARQELKIITRRMQWKKKEYKTTAEGRTSSARAKEDIIDAKGKHDPLVSEEIFTKAQEILKGKYHVPYQLVNGVTNPLAGLIRCAKCRYAMVLRPYAYQPSHLMCYNKECDCRSTRFEFVESAVVSALKEWLKSYKVEIGKNKPLDRSGNDLELKKMTVSTFVKEREELELQKGRLHDFLERGIYSEDVYLERSQGLAVRMEDTNKLLELAEEKLTEELNRETKQNNIIPLITNVIKLYERSTDQGKKNTLLKSILEKIEYRKETHQRNDNFEIELFPKV